MERKNNFPSADGIFEEESLMEVIQLTSELEMYANSNNADVDKGYHHSLKSEAVNRSNTFHPNAMLCKPEANLILGQHDAGEGNTCDRHCDSPLIEPTRISVQAVVHHPLNWSPSGDKCSGSFRNEGFAKKHQHQKQSDKDDSGFDGEEMDSSSSSTDSIVISHNSKDNSVENKV